MQYLRDGRAPAPKSEIVSRIMRANKAKNTVPELALRAALNKLRFFTRSNHAKELPGRPDLINRKKRVAIFVNGCFWHRCPYCKKSLPKIHKEFWRKKFLANKKRDKEKIILLRKMGWRVFTVWECKLKKGPDVTAKRIIRYSP